jgi:hypothetical protein
MLKFFDYQLSRFLSFAYMLIGHLKAVVIPGKRWHWKWGFGIQRKLSIFICCIVLPCALEFLLCFTLENSAEYKHGREMFGKQGFVDNVVQSGNILPVGKKDQFSNKGISELSCSGIKSSTISKAELKTIDQESTNESTEYRTADSNKCYFVGTKAQFWIALLSGWITGIFISYGILRFIFWV